MGILTRRGLGLLVLGVLLFVIGAVATTAIDPMDPNVVIDTVALSAGAIAMLCFVVGLFLIAWDLLRN